jgi:hypothetical protein
VTKEEFLAALTACAGQYQWQLDGVLVRASSEHAPKCYCPITAVYHANPVASHLITLGQWKCAVPFLGLTQDDANAIVRAADHSDLDVDPALRQALLTAVGLQGDTP